MEENKDKKIEFDIIASMRAIAVFLIVSTHCCVLPLNTPLIISKGVMLYQSISTFGVWIFFLLAGYMFAYSTDSFGKMLGKKIKAVIIPWFFTGGCIYLYTFSRHGGLSFKSWAMFVIGDGSYLWYMSVYFSLLLIFYKLKQKPKYIFPIIFLTFLVEISRRHYILVGENYNLYYFIAGAWPIAFGTGFLINYYALSKKMYYYINKYGKIYSWINGVVIISCFLKIGKWTYWDKYYILLCILSTVSFIWIAIVCKEYTFNLEIGKKSFSIYLLHMPIAGVINNLFCRFDRGILVPIRTFIVLFFTYGVIIVIQRIGKKINFSKGTKLLIGIR